MFCSGNSALDQLSSDISSKMRDHGSIRVSGKVVGLMPGGYALSGISEFARLGDLVRLDSKGRQALAEVVRVDKFALAKSFEADGEIVIGAPVRLSGRFVIAPHESWQGRILNALAEPLDDAGPIRFGPRRLSTDQAPPAALGRERVTRPVKTGVRVIDSFAPLCAGQRLGIFAGSGVGKSTMLGMMAQGKDFDVVVVALVGERGREVREFLDETLGKDRSRAIVVVATGDESAMMRRQAPKTAMTIAEYFRDLGKSVLLIVDSVTRYAHAARDIALAAGEPPVARGYPPSVFSDLPRLLERAGPGARGQGSITGLFAVLVDGDDHNDPVADSIRGTLDGHIVLDRAIADEGRYPAVNILASLSRLAHQVWTPDQAALVRKLRAMISRFEDTRDLRLMGGYHNGADAYLDQAIKLTPRIYAAMQQTPQQPQSQDAFREMAERLQDPPGEKVS